VEFRGLIPGVRSVVAPQQSQHGGQPRAVFVLHRLELRKGGLTKAWLQRVRLFEADGWSVHLALISPDPEIEETLRVLRAEERLPESVEVHHFSRDRRGPPGRVSARMRLSRRPRQAESVAAWLDRVASPDGALIFSDSPLGYPHLAGMHNPRVARVYVVHLAHLSAEATRLPTRTEIANGPMTTRWNSVSDETIRAADRLVVLTEAQKDDFRLRWGADLPVEVIPHCADPVDVPPHSGYDPHLVVVIGRLDYYKRWDDAIRIMALVVREIPEARLEIHGRGDDIHRLQAITEKLGMSDSVTFAGYTTAPLEVMAGAACVISTTRREAMPLSLLETLAVGTPAVVYDIRYGPREIVRDGVDGFVVPGKDVRAAAAAVVRLLREPGLRDRMSHSAREVTTRFSREAHDQAWLSLGHDLYAHRVEGSAAADVPQPRVP
jgi:glycosyltransferase involved in cell wall biosynthesis